MGGTPPPFAGGLRGFGPAPADPRELQRRGGDLAHAAAGREPGPEERCLGPPGAVSHPFLGWEGFPTKITPAETPNS